MEYAVIMAGGAGKRLWPLSRLSRPKQLLSLIGGKSLLELAIERLDGLFDPANILVITNQEYAEAVAAALPQLPPESIIGEPVGRDTANAVALGAEIIAGRDPEGVMAVFTADHVIRPVEVFVGAVRAAFRAVQDHPDALVTFGVRPTWPNIGLGYIHCESPVADGVHEVQDFQEKPDHHTARRYVESGKHFWNSGMFVWKVQTVRDVLRRLLPNSARDLQPVSEAVQEGRDYRPILAEVYPKLQKISIDYAVMEKAKRVLMVELNCEWLDVGAWPALEDVADLDEAGNVVLAENASITDSFRNIVVSEDDHLLAVLGMDDCIVVHSKDVTLVCNKSDAQRLKELVDLVVKEFGDKYT